MSLPPENRLVAMSRLVALGLVAEHLVELYYDTVAMYILEHSHHSNADIFRLAITCAVKIRCIRALTGDTP